MIDNYYTKMDNSFDYIIDQKASEYSLDKYTKNKIKLDELVKQLNDLRNTEPKDMWITDLTELKQVIN